MGTFATISLINARLHAQIQERNDHLLMLNELSRKISTTLDLQELLQMVLNFCLRITQAEIGYIFNGHALQRRPPSALPLQGPRQIPRTGSGAPDLSAGRA